MGDEAELWCVGGVCQRCAGGSNEGCHGSDDHVSCVARQILNDDEEQSSAAGTLLSYASQVRCRSFVLL